MNQGFLRRLREEQDTDGIWKGGMGVMFLLLFLFLAVISLKSADLIVYALIYGILNLAVFLLTYLLIAQHIHQVLYQLGDMMECLIGGKEKPQFPMVEDTILSKLQGQLLKLYDILCSYQEREQKLRKQLDENIGNLVHQINTPITNISLYAGFMKRDDLTLEERNKFLDCMEAQAEKLSWLGESFSKISRMETGIIRLKPEKQSLLPIILCAVNQVMEKAERKGMEIKLKDEIKPMAIVDAKWTAEAVFNVLDNAVKYGEEGSEIEIEVSKLTSYIRVAVRNRGIEIDKEEYHNIFKRFYRGKKTAGEEGVGLGLYITRKILEEERGYIEVRALQDKKTEFILYFMEN